MSMLLSEFCMVQVLEGLEKLSALQNSELSAFGRYCINGASTRTAS